MDLPAALDPAWLDGPDASARLAAMDRAERVAASTDAVRAAREEGGALWLARLGALRRALTLAGERPALALALTAQAELATAQGEHALAADALDSLWGVRELLDQPWKAHAARLQHAEAVYRSGDAARAELLLTQAQQPARELARTGEVARASVLLAEGLALLAAVLEAEGRTEEAALWREGAVDVAPDPETAARVQQRQILAGSPAEEPEPDPAASADAPPARQL
jgi:tetratricopeptide (TPR) repeat protein